MEQILILEDDIALNQGLCKALKTENRKIVSCETIKAARDQLLCGCPSLILLDINLPDGSGLDFLQELKRNYPTIPVILLTANDTDMDIVKGLELGADDYLTKPFRVGELRARVAAHLRRQNRVPVYRMVRSGVSFDMTGKSASYAEKELPLTRSEYAICEYLALHAGQTFTKEQIYEAVFGVDGTADDTAITQHIKNIRVKLRAAGAPETLLKTVWGVGYQWKNEN